MDIDAFEKSLKEGISPIYSFVGSQTFLFEMALEALREAVCVGPFSDMNFDQFYAKEKGAIPKAFEMTGQMPMMARMRMVVIREADAIKGDDAQKLAEYLLSPSKFCCLVLWYEKLAKNTKIWKRSGKNGLAMAFERIYERQMPFWIKRMALRHGKEISGQGVSFLTRAVGADLAKANAELEKAALYAGDKQTIDAQDLEAVLAAVKSESIFQLTDSIGAKDRTNAIYLSKKMMDAGEQPLRILWQVTSHMKRLMLVRSLISAKMPAAEIGRAMGVMDFVRDKLIGQAKAFARRDLRMAMVRITQADLELKSGRLNNRLVLEKLILDLSEVKTKKGPANSLTRSR